ncbi:hypothetical protein HPB48_009197 [Haemaphysalis longicornis]|uniref:CCHC-type domain-containing protein n=1 Tax=Haemaphysalis longicornis TaxID=44386 RepID=A0A9J6GXU7_HAELO|nr:hypothetical protein HPB48_009197 [Haemaphysalis longicornis]
MSGDEDNESVSGGSDVQSEVLSERQMEYNLKMARERRKNAKNWNLLLPIVPLDRVSPAQLAVRLRAGRVPVNKTNSRSTPVKEVVLEELRLSPSEYQKWFLGARKPVDLLVADQLKTGLTEEALKYVRLQSAKLLQTFEGAAGNKDASAEANVTNEEKPATKPSGFNQQSKGKPSACFECGAEGHLRPNCPRVRERQTAATKRASAHERLIARVATEGPTGVGDRLTSVTMHCGNQEISSIVDTGAEITVVRESIVLDALTESHGTVKLASAFGEQVEAKLVVLPLALRAGQAIFSNVGEGTPVLCARHRQANIAKTEIRSRRQPGMVATQTKREELVAALELNEADAPQETLEQGEENANEAVTATTEPLDSSTAASGGLTDRRPHWRTSRLVLIG